MKPDISDSRQKRNKDSKKAPTPNLKWIITIFLSTVLISGVFSMISSLLLLEANLVSAFVILFVIILIGIIFDIIGVAVTAADAKPFHSMAAHKVPGAQEALTMLKNAEKMSSFCNDVVGDICGVISGTACASIVLLLVSAVSIFGRAPSAVELVMAALVSGLTVGGKAFGKFFAMNQSVSIIMTAARLVYYVKNGPKLILRSLGGKK